MHYVKLSLELKAQLHLFFMVLLVRHVLLLKFQAQGFLLVSVFLEFIALVLLHLEVATHDHQISPVRFDLFFV